jgi:hypothetical protein
MQIVLHVVRYSVLKRLIASANSKERQIWQRIVFTSEVKRRQHAVRTLLWPGSYIPAVRLRYQSIIDTLFTAVDAYRFFCELFG